MSSPEITESAEEIKIDYEERAKRIMEAPRARLEEKAKEPNEKLAQLPLWPDSFRAAPNCLLRSALFRVIERGKRRASKEEVLASWPGVEIRFTGWQLDQADLDVWMQADFIGRDCLGHKIFLNERNFLRFLGRSCGGKNIQWLRSSFIRLTGGVVSLRMNSIEYHGALVDEFYRDEETGKYVVVLNKKLASLFKTGFTLMELEERKKIKSDLAKWMQGYVESQRATKQNPHRIGIEKLRTLCGSEIAEIRFFRRNLRNAMEELKVIGVVDNWEMKADGSVLEFSRPQRRFRLSESSTSAAGPLLADDASTE